MFLKLSKNDLSMDQMHGSLTDRKCDQFWHADIYADYSEGDMGNLYDSMRAL